MTDARVVYHNPPWDIGSPCSALTRTPRTGALRATTHRGLQPAMDHLLAHADEDVPTASSHSAGAVDTDASDAAKRGDNREGQDDDEDADADAALDVQAKVRPSGPSLRASW